MDYYRTNMEGIKILKEKNMEFDDENKSFFSTRPQKPLTMAI